MDSMFNTPQEVVQANMNGAVKKATTSKKKVFFMGIMAGVCIALGAQSSNFPDHGIRCIRLRTLRCKYVLYSGRNLCFYESGLCCKSERIIWYHRQSDCCFKLGKLLHHQSSSCYNR